MSAHVRIHDLPLPDRPRERLAAQGAESLSRTDLIAILLRTGTRGSSALGVASALLSRFGSLRSLALASLEDLRKIKGVGRDKAVTLKAAFTLARQMAEELRLETPLLETPDQVAALLRDEARHDAVEVFRVALLNTRRRLLRIERLSQGTLDTLLVHPREVFRTAILANAAAIIIAHNHPSGDPTPSEADIKVTRDLIRAGQVLKIEVLDHVILGQATQLRPKDFVSLRELGYFYS
ncbi:MAG: DNA repair protein RadC [Verrucomicrobia bacterium]|nr:DNA repair protein RadC [Verrucomicrobiota bacterium]